MNTIDLFASLQKKIADETVGINPPESKTLPPAPPVGMAPQVLEVPSVDAMAAEQGPKTKRGRKPKADAATEPPLFQDQSGGAVVTLGGVVAGATPRELPKLVNASDSFDAAWAALGEAVKALIELKVVV